MRGSVVDGHDNITHLDTGLESRRAVLHLADEDTVVDSRDILLLGKLRSKFLICHSDHSPLHGTELPDVVDHLGDHRRRNGERIAYIVARLGIDGGVDADQFTLHVDQCTAGIARVYSRIGLDIAFDTHGATHGRLTNTACLGADDTGGDGRCKTEGITHGQYPFTYTECVAVADRNHRKILCVDFQKCHIGGGVGTHHSGVIDTVVVERNLKAVCTLNHMVVGDDISVGRHYDTRAEAAGLLLRFFLAALLTRLLTSRRTEKELI